MTGRPTAVDLPEVRALLRSQRRLARRDQLADAGICSDDVAAHVRAGRWRTLGPVVVALENGDLDVQQLRWAAVLASGPRGALAAWTALQEHGLRGYEREELHVVLTRGDKHHGIGRGSRRLVVHESRRHGLDDVVRRRGRVPSHDPARAAVDAGAWAVTDRAAAGVLIATVQQRLATVDQVQAALDRAGRVRRGRLLRLVLGDVAGGVHALSELDFARLCRRHGLPEPDRQRTRRDPQGRLRYLDVEWRRRRDGRLVVVEVDGRGHMRQDTWEDDLLRQNDVTIDDGALVQRVPSTIVRTAEHLVVPQLRRVLR